MQADTVLSNSDFELRTTAPLSLNTFVLGDYCERPQSLVGYLGVIQDSVRAALASQGPAWDLRVKRGE